MRHHNANRKFGRKRKVRSALIKSLLVSLIRDEKIKTTEPKAKEIRSHIEKLVTKAQNNTLATKRVILSKIGNLSQVKKLMDVIAPKYKGRKGGYTRVVKLGNRLRDGSKMAIIEFV